MWEDVPASWCRTGLELEQLWDTLQLEAGEMCHFLGEKLEEIPRSASAGNWRQLGRSNLSSLWKEVNK